MKPWLSIIVPVHEGDAFLARTLGSAAASDPGGRELAEVEFLLYDSSADTQATRKIVAGFEDRLRIRYQETPELEAWTAKTNRGVAEARGEHIAMLHQDDLWLPGHLRALKYAVAAAPQAAMSVASSHYVDAHDHEIGDWKLPFAPGLHESRTALRALLVQNVIAIPSPVIRRDAWIAVGGMDEALWYTADWDLYLKLAAHGPVHVRCANTTAFRIHAGSLTMQGRLDAEAFRAQQEVVLARHLEVFSGAAGALVPSRSQRALERLARVSIEVNCALGQASAGHFLALAGAALSLLRLGPGGVLAYLHGSRLIDRLRPRLRLHWRGALE